MATYRDSAVVLRTYKLGEADRIVVMLGEQRGKIRSVGKGARKPKSRFGARLEPGAHVSVQLYEGRSLDVVSQVETIDTYAELRSDLARLAAAASVLEAVDAVAQEGVGDARLFRMTVGALRTLRDAPTPRVFPAFALRLLAVEGVGLEVERCVSCGEAAELVAVDVVAGGGLCRACGGGQPVQARVIEAIRRVNTGQVSVVLAEPPDTSDHEFGAVALHALEVHVGQKLKAPRMHTQ